MPYNAKNFATINHSFAYMQLQMERKKSKKIFSFYFLIIEMKICWFTNFPRELSLSPINKYLNNTRIDELCYKWNELNRFYSFV